MASQREAPARGASGHAGAGTHAAFVRVTGIRLNRFVEFEYILDDADLTVELILPFAAFEEFCRARGATRLPDAADESDDAHRDSAGLLQRLPGDGDTTH